MWRCNRSDLPQIKLNSLIYGSPFYIVIYERYKLLKQSGFLAHLVHLHSVFGLLYSVKQ